MQTSKSRSVLSVAKRSRNMKGLRTRHLHASTLQLSLLRSARTGFYVTLLTCSARAHPGTRWRMIDAVNSDRGASNERRSD
jgi:hypothetical protein